MAQYSRYFSLVSYCTEQFLKKVFKAKLSSIRAFCYIKHDYEAEPHFHILMRTHSTWTCKQIKSWFNGCVVGGKEQNTLVEIAGDMDALKAYILHADPKSIEEGKHRYSEKDVKDYGMYDLTDDGSSYDKTYEILVKYMGGANIMQLVRYYGKDFLYHYRNYVEVADMVRHQNDLRLDYLKLDGNLHKFISDSPDSIDNDTDIALYFDENKGE